MCSVEEPIERTAAPRDRALEAGIEHGEDAPQGRYRDAGEVPPLDEGDERLGHAGGASDIDLPEPEAQPQGSKDPADTDVVHDAGW